MMKIPLFAALLGLLLFTGCSSINTRVEPNVDLRQYKRAYVVTAGNDSNHIDEIIAAELRKLGYDAGAGVRTMAPYDTDITVHYDGQWTWDGRIYLLQLVITVRDARTEQQLATARNFHPGVTSKSPERMVHEVLGAIFAAKLAGKS